MAEISGTGRSTNVLFNWDANQNSFLNSLHSYDHFKKLHVVKIVISKQSYSQWSQATVEGRQELSASVTDIKGLIHVL